MAPRRPGNAETRAKTRKPLVHETICISKRDAHRHGLSGPVGDHGGRRRPQKMPPLSMAGRGRRNAMWSTRLSRPAFALAALLALPVAAPRAETTYPDKAVRI